MHAASYSPENDMLRVPRCLCQESIIWEEWACQQGTLNLNLTLWALKLSTTFFDHALSWLRCIASADLPLQQRSLGLVSLFGKPAKKGCLTAISSVLTEKLPVLTQLPAMHSLLFKLSERFVVA